MIATIEELCSVIVDCEHKTAPQDNGGGYYAVGTPAMRGNVIDYEQARQISRETFDAWTRRLKPQWGDLLFAREAPVGPVVLIPRDENVAPGQRTVLMRPNPELADSRFLYYLLTSQVQQDRLQAKAGGSTVAHLNVADIREFSLNVPSVSNQRAIAEVLGALDDKVAANTKLAITSAQLATVLFSSSLKEDAITASLSDLVVLLSRGITPSYTDDVDQSMVILNQKCVRGQRVDLDPARRTKLEKVRAEKKLIAEDVLINSTGQGTLGRVARWTVRDEATVDSHITIVRFDASKADPTFGGFAMMAMQPDIEAMGEGSTGQTELSRVELGKLQIRVPRLETSLRVGEKLRKMSAMEDAALMENRTLAATRDALLPRLMSGKVRVKGAEKVLEGVL